MSKWVDILDAIHLRRRGTLLEFAGVIMGILLLAASIILISTNPEISTESENMSWIIVYLAATALFILIDFASFGIVLKKFNNRFKETSVPEMAIEYKQSEKPKETKNEEQPKTCSVQSPP